MGRINLKISCLIVMMLLSVNASWANQKIRQIVCIGDDITKGIWREEMIGNGTRWVDILASYDKNMDVVNAGVTGLESGDVNYLSSVLSKYPNASMYIIYLGVNDIKEINNIDSGAAASIGAKIMRMVKTINIAAPAAEVVIVAPQRLGEENLSSEWVKKGMGEHTPVVSDLVSASLEVVAKKTKTRFVNLLDKISPAMLPDGISPNISGHLKIAELIWNEISHPYEETDNIESNIVIAPPPIGAPIANAVATEDLVEGIAGDIEELQGLGSTVKNAGKPINKLQARARNYVNNDLAKGIITKSAYMLGKAIGKKIIIEVESSILEDIDSAMEAQFASLDRGESEKGSISEIKYSIPEPVKVQSYITSISSNNNKFETLADAVDWDKIKITVQNTDSDKVKNMQTAEKSNEASEMQIKEIATISEQAKIDVIEDNNKIVELWLPELDVLDEKEITAELSEENTLNTVTEIAEKLVKNEVKEVFAVAEPIEYTGYAVFIHTGINE